MDSADVFNSSTKFKFPSHLKDFLKLLYFLKKNHAKILFLNYIGAMLYELYTKKKGKILTLPYDGKIIHNYQKEKIIIITKVPLIFKNIFFK